MAKKANLTPQRKAELKKNVLEALDGKKIVSKPINSINNIIREEIKPMAKIVKKDFTEETKTKKNSPIPRAVKTKKLSRPKVAISSNIKLKSSKAAGSKAIKKDVATIKVKEKIAVNKDSNVVGENRNQGSQVDWESIFPSQATQKRRSPLPLPSLPKFSGSSAKPILPWKKAESKETEPIDIFAQAKESKKEKKSGSRWLRLIVALLLALILVISFDILGIYKFNFSDPLSYQVMKAFNLPAGTINGSNLSLSDYHDDLKFLSSALAKKREGLPDLSAFEDMPDKVFYRQAANILVHRKLAEYGKPVSEDFLNGQINLLVAQSGGVKEAESTINAIYGLKLSQFKEMILRPLAEREFLQEAIAADESLEINKQAKERAEVVLQMALAEGVDFNALASQYTDDEVGVNTGGDLGWAIQGQLDPAWEEEILALTDGKVLPKVIKNKFGYHVVKVEKKMSDPDTGKESVKLRHILIKVDVDKYIKEILDQATIKKYID